MTTTRLTPSQRAAAVRAGRWWRKGKAIAKRLTIEAGAGRAEEPGDSITHLGDLIAEALADAAEVEQAQRRHWLIHALRCATTRGGRAIIQEALAKLQECEP
jgi:hypothetical protein